jgi:transmembrane protein EpsG
MYVVIILCIFSVFFAWLEDTNQYKHGLRVSFFLIFIFLALRYNFGNDYHSYLELFQEVQGYEFSNLLKTDWKVEFGWIFLCWICSPFGFFGMIILLALFNSILFYLLFKRYAPKGYYSLSIFLYLATPELFLIHSSAMRQALSTLIFLFSLRYIYERKIIKYTLCIIVASFFHTSALILLPVYLLTFVRGQISKILGVAVFSLYILIFYFGQYIISNSDVLTIGYFDKYLTYSGVSSVGSGIGVIYFSVLLILFLFYQRFVNEEYGLIFKIAIISYFFIPLSFFIPMVGRLDMYFTPALIFGFPILYIYIKNKKYKLTFIILLVFMVGYQFFIFFYSKTYGHAFFEYNTIFSSNLQ